MEKILRQIMESYAPENIQDGVRALDDLRREELAIREQRVQLASTVLKLAAQPAKRAVLTV